MSVPDQTPISTSLTDPASMAINGNSVSAKSAADIIALYKLQAQIAALGQPLKGAQITQMEHAPAFQGCPPCGWDTFWSCYQG